MPTLTQAWPTARKIHRCDSCRRPIQAGERYSRWTGTNDAWIGIATAKDCAECCARYGRAIPDASPRKDQT